jgi:hypothetical protein
MCGMIESIHRGEEGAPMLRKKKSLVDRAVDSASDAVDAALPVIENAVTQVREQVRDLSKEAAAGAKDLAKESRTKAAPLIADTKVLASEIAEATREVAIPKVKTAAAAGAAGAAGLAASGKELAAAKVAEVKGEPPKRKGSKLRKLLFFGTLAAVAGFIYNKMRPQPEADNWQSTYTPPASAGSTSSTTSSTTSATTGSAAAAAGGAHLAPGVGPDEPLATDDPMARLAAEGATTDDPGGASPDEAIADAVEEPHEVTTPDDPADVVEVEDKAGKNK